SHVTRRYVRSRPVTISSYPLLSQKNRLLMIFSGFSKVPLTCVNIDRPSRRPSRSMSGADLAPPPERVVEGPFAQSPKVTITTSDYPVTCRCRGPFRINYYCKLHIHSSRWTLAHSPGIVAWPPD